MSRKPTAVMPSDASTASLRVVDNEPVASARSSDPASPTLAFPTLTQGMDPVIKNTEDFVALGKQNLEALAASGKIWSAGTQDLAQQFAAAMKASLEESVATVKALSSVKTPKEAIELQTTYYKTAVARALAETTRLTEASMKLTEQALAPLTARLAVAVDVFAKAA
jgi:phasin family protein